MLKPNGNTDLLILLPNTYVAERTYIINTVIQCFLGITFNLEFSDKHSSVVIQRDNKNIKLADSFFQIADNDWLTRNSLPKTPLAIFNTRTLPIRPTLTKAEVPVLFGDPEHFFSDTQINLQIDIFGSCFFMLTRYEEYVVDEKDEHERFPAKESLAFQEGFLHRPIVNEYTEILWGCISHLWPELKRKKHEFKITPTHDVDRPFKFLNKTYWSLIKSTVEECFYRGSPINSLQLLRQAILSKMTKGDNDPFNTFDYIMTQCEKRGLQSEFYFLTDVTDPLKDADYTLRDDSIRQLMLGMKQRKHIFGLHPSYNSFINKKQIEKEYSLLMKSCDELGIRQSKWGGRQHYLRFNTPETWNSWDYAKMDYDSSLYFAEAPGFRAGCCYEYPLFDVAKKNTMSLVERPLILMDSSFIDSNYFSISSESQFSLVAKLKTTCELFGGNFLFLWHNSNLVCPAHKTLYEFTLDH